MNTTEITWMKDRIAFLKKCLSEQMTSPTACQCYREIDEIKKRLWIIDGWMSNKMGAEEKKSIVRELSILMPQLRGIYFIGNKYVEASMPENDENYVSFFTHEIRDILFKYGQKLISVHSSFNSWSGTKISIELSPIENLKNIDNE